MPQITLSFFLANAGPLLILVLKVGAVVGLVGSTLEAIGLFAQHFANPYAQRTGAALVRFGKILEAAGTDVPKFVENATGWVSKFAKLFGTAAIFLLACGLLFGARL